MIKNPISGQGTNTGDGDIWSLGLSPIFGDGYRCGNGGGGGFGDGIISGSGNGDGSGYNFSHNHTAHVTALFIDEDLVTTAYQAYSMQSPGDHHG